MELGPKQVLMLSAISSRKGLTGPELSSMVENFIAPIQFQQHVARLRNAGLITTERVEGEIYNEVKLTKKGEEMLAEAKELFSLVLKWSK